MKYFITALLIFGGCYVGTLLPNEFKFIGGYILALIVQIWESLYDCKIK